MKRKKRFLVIERRVLEKINREDQRGVSIPEMVEEVRVRQTLEGPFVDTYNYLGRCGIKGPKAVVEGCIKLLAFAFARQEVGRPIQVTIETTSGLREVSLLDYLGIVPEICERPILVVQVLTNNFSHAAQVK